MQRQRGQTLPLALAGTIAMLVFAFFALNYANTVRWQIRAQSAADSAAQAVLTLQTQDFNAMNATLYAAAVEEYRIRHLLNGMVLAAHNQGGCFATSAATCVSDELLLEAQYDAAVSRYTDDVKALQQVTSTLNYANIYGDGVALLNRIEDCTNALSGDCAFHYGALQMTQRTDTEYVTMDAKRIVLPFPGKSTGASGVNPRLFAPVQVEVWVCAVVPSPIPNFFLWTFPPFHAIARGAATPVMVEQDWLQPGAVMNPWPPYLPYQPIENYAGVTASEWYDLNFGGNPNVAVSTLGFSSDLQNPDGSVVNGFMSVYVGWWNSIPVHPVTQTETPAALGCTS